MSVFLKYLCYSILLLSSVNCSDEEVKPLLLFEATIEGNVEVTKWLLDHGADINVKDAAGKTPLMRLVELEDTSDMMKFMLKHGADTEATDFDGNTVLLLAAKNGKSEQFRYLIHNKANINARDKRGRTVLHLAAENERCELLKNCDSKCSSLLYSTDHWGRTPLWYAANRGNFECYSTLKEIGSKTDSGTLIASVNGGNLDIVGDLLYAGKNINEKNASGLSLVQIACDKKHGAIAKYLIVKGADIKVRDNENRNLLLICSASGLEEVVSILLSRGFDVNSTDAEGNTALHYAAINNEPSVISLLKKSGGNIKARNKANKTPVELAVEYDSIDALKWFIENGYGIDEQSSSKKTLCHVAAEAGSTTALWHLIKLGANCNKIGESGNRPIHYATRYTGTLKVLLIAGVDLDAPGAEGRTPLEMAVDIGNKNAVMCLLRFGAKPDQVRERLNIDNRYYAYSTNKSITIELMDLIKNVKNGTINATNIDC